jgi:hypothetical protein
MPRNPLPIARGALQSLLVLGLPASPAQEPDPAVPDGMVLVVGVVRNHFDGAPLPGVHITMRDPTAGCDSPATQTVSSDAEGRFRFLPFRPGPRFLVTNTPVDPATKSPPFPPTETDILPEGPGRIEMELVLGELGSVAGNVVDEESGAPVRGARAAIRNSDHPPATSGAGGEFRLDGLALRNRSQQVVVDSPGYASFWGSLLLGAESVEGMTIRMRRARQAFGTVRNEKGEPVGRVPDPEGKPVPIVVDLQGRGQIPFVHPDGRLELRENSPGRVDVKAVETDENGRWAIAELDPDFVWSLALRELPYRKDEVPSFSFGPKEYWKRLNLTLVPSRRIEGRVVSDDGEPMERGGALLAAAAAIVNEVFEVPLVELDGAEGGLPVGPRWAGDAGDRIATFPDRISASARMRETHLAKIEAGGRFEFPGVETGPTLFFVRRMGTSPTAFVRNVAAEEGSWEVTLYPVEPVTVKGRVVNDQGRGRPAVQVRAVAAVKGKGEVPWVLARGTTDEGGAFSMRFEYGGPWRVVAGEGTSAVESEMLRGSPEEVVLPVK